MRNQIRVKEKGEPIRGRSLYDQDFAKWIERQVESLRAGRAAALDVPNLIEELEGLTKRDERALGSQLKRIMAHMLKQQHQPQRASRSWIDSIENGREEIADILEQSPSLRRILSGLMSKNYPRAVAQASRDTRLPVDQFPAQPPFTLEEVLRGER
jgi:Domain of unknown function DUF29